MKKIIYIAIISLFAGPWALAHHDHSYSSERFGYHSGCHTDWYNNGIFRKYGYHCKSHTDSYSIYDNVRDYDRGHSRYDYDYDYDYDDYYRTSRRGTRSRYGRVPHRRSNPARYPERRYRRY